MNDPADPSDPRLMDAWPPSGERFSKRSDPATAGCLRDAAHAHRLFHANVDITDLACAAAERRKGAAFDREESRGWRVRA
jgi:hypothetical protein